jgi:hypothetical protein
MKFSISSPLGRGSPFTGGDLSGSLPLNSIAPMGQIAKQCWHFMHFSGWESEGKPFSPIERAPKKQSREQAPHLMHREESNLKNPLSSIVFSSMLLVYQKPFVRQ